MHGIQENNFELYTDEAKDYLGYLLEQKRLGRIRYIGFSSHAAPETLEKFLDICDKHDGFDGFDMALIQVNYLDWTLLDAKRQYEILTERNIPVWIMEPLKGGRLINLDEEAAAILKKVSPERSISSWAFRFLMSLDNVQVVLSGMSTVEQIYQNVETFEKLDILSEEESKALEKAKDIFIKKIGVPCSSCRYCCEDCPQELDIPLLMTAYNEISVSGKIWRVQKLDSTKGPKECLKCEACKKHCPQKIDIPDVLEKLGAMLEKL